jgi:hypothetical protein
MKFFGILLQGYLRCFAQFDIAFDANGDICTAFPQLMRFLSEMSECMAWDLLFG